MELSNGRTEQASFPCVNQEYHPVGDIAFQFQRQRTAIDKTVLIRQHRAIGQQLVPPVTRFVPGKGRQSQRQEKGFLPVGKEVHIVTALTCELAHGYLQILIGVMLFEVFPADNPPVPIFCIGGKSCSEIIGEIAFTVPVNTVRHAARNLQA